MLSLSFEPDGSDQSRRPHEVSEETWAKVQEKTRDTDQQLQHHDSEIRSYHQNDEGALANLGMNE